MAVILVVDDREPNREYLRALLSHVGHRVIEAADGLEALEIARGERPDLAIVDIVMPTLDGQEFVNALRSEPALARIPVIFYTATYSEREARALAAASGVSDVLTKPCEPERVLSVVHASLGLALPELPAAVSLPEGVEIVDADPLRTRAAAQRLAALLELSLESAQHDDPLRLIETFCCGARKLIGARYAAVGMLGENGGSFRHFFTTGMGVPVAYSTGQRTSSLITRVLTEGRPLRVDDLPGDPEAAGLPANHPSLRSFLGVPLASASRRYGILYLGEKLGARGFSEDDARLAVAVAAQLTTAYQSAERRGELLAQAERLRHEMAERSFAERRFRALVENSADALVLIGHDRSLRYANHPVTRSLGSVVNELSAQPDAMEHVHPDDRAAVTDALGECVRRPGVTMRMDFRYRTETGDWRAAEGVAVDRSDDPAIGAIVANLRDVTDRRRLEEQLAQSGKLEAIGQLAGGVAHDFNNLLGVITGYSDLLARELPSEPRLHQRLAQIRRASDRAAALTRQLLAFSRRQVLQLRRVELANVVTELQGMLRRLIGEHIELASEMAAGLPAVRADPSQIEQVVMNLVINARDAMPDGGRVTIQAYRADALPETAQLETGARNPSPQDYIVLEVSDTGSGIAPEVLPHIFEPFFTTKEPGRGTGLGLATVYGIVRQTGGHLEVVSRPAAGSSFRIYLPVDHGPAPAPSVERGVPVTSGRNETILLVEDDAALRELVLELLQEAGYRVIAAETPARALEVAATASTLDLVLTDVVMPGMSGPRMVELLRAGRPELVVVYMSGYPRDAVDSQAPAEGEQLIEKPVTREYLLQRVGEALDGRSG